MQYKIKVIIHLEERKSKKAKNTLQVYNNFLYDYITGASFTTPTG